MVPIINPHHVTGIFASGKGSRHASRRRDDLDETRRHGLLMQRHPFSNGAMPLNLDHVEPALRDDL
jgi:hypothetical protein